MALVINQQEREDVVVLELSGKLIFGEECNAFNKQIKDLLDANKNKVILNLEGVSSCDSAGLGCLVRALMSTRRQNGDLKILSPSQKVQDLLDLTRVTTIWETHTTEDEAVASFK